MAEPADDHQPVLRGLAGLIARLREAARAFVRAEVEYVIAQLGARTATLVPAVVMIGIALVLGCSALTALLIGIMIALAPNVTIWGSLALVTLVVVVIIAILIWRARAIFEQTFEGETENETNA